MAICDIIMPAQDGWITCPSCRKKLLKITADTEAENLPIRCPRCKEEYNLQIRRDRSA